MAEVIERFSIPDASILVVDDSCQNLKLLARILAKAGYLVVQAASAQEMRRQLAVAIPDLILLDVLLGETTGYRLCEELKQNPQTSGVPIIFLSGLSTAMDKVKAFSVGGADYVTKPFHSAEVLARVAHQVKMVRLQQQLQRDKEQLTKKNAELLQSQQQTSVVFHVLADHLRSKELDGKYALEEKIGSGGYGVVFRAIQLDTRQEVAVKIFRPTGRVAGDVRRNRFRQEGIAACRISHPNAVAVLDFGSSPDGIDYLVMELLRGHPLSDELKEHLPLPAARCLQVIEPVCRVLVEAHKAGLVHRDIKPENIFLHRDDRGELVKVLDFGIAKLIGADDLRRTVLTPTGTVIGSPLYMSPEQFKGEPCDGRSDVYSVGLMFYELLSGNLPFPASENVFSMMYSQLGKPLPSLRAQNPAIPELLEEVVMSALVKDPLERPTAQELLAHLLHAACAVFGAAEVERLLPGRVAAPRTGP